MVFEIWMHLDEKKGLIKGTKVLISKCIARRNSDEVRPEYHNMMPGESRSITKDGDSFIVRVQ